MQVFQLTTVIPRVRNSVPVPLQEPQRGGGGEKKGKQVAVEVVPIRVEVDHIRGGRKGVKKGVKKVMVDVGKED